MQDKKRVDSGGMLISRVVDDFYIMYVREESCR